MSIRSQLEEIINWYDEFAKSPPKVIAVCATANTVRKFARKKNGVYRFRGYEIHPIRKVKTREERMMESFAEHG